MFDSGLGSGSLTHCSSGGMTTEGSSVQSGTTSARVAVVTRVSMKDLSSWIRVARVIVAVRPALICSNRTRAGPGRGARRNCALVVTGCS